jgi:putative transcriptional regulator
MRNRFKELRKEHKYSLEDIAKQVGISKVYIWQIENDKRRLNYTLAIKIAEIFEMKPDDLFYDDEYQKIKTCLD